MVRSYCIGFFSAEFRVANDRSVRFLSALGGASTSRVLIFSASPPTMRTIPNISKSRCSSRPSSTRPSCSSTAPAPTKATCSPVPRAVATKIIIPFDSNDLRAGGRSLFVDQRGYAEIAARGGQLPSRLPGARPDGLAAAQAPRPAWGSVPAARAFAQSPDRSRAQLFRHLRGRPGTHAPLCQPGNVQADHAGGRQRRFFRGGWCRPCCPTRSTRSWSPCA